jgi:hypothetical protein
MQARNPIGSDQVVMMAGPCSVGEQQMEAVSEIVALWCPDPARRSFQTTLVTL